MAGDSDIEARAAELLGRMLFAFSRLEVTLGLCVAWTDGGREIEARSRQIEDQGLHQRLELLSKSVERLPNGSRSRLDYERWIADCHDVRRMRNAFIHGRWAVVPDGRIVNVAGLPTLSGQVESRFTLADLEAALESVRALDERLHDIRDRDPL